MNLEESIIDILESFVSGEYFDSHSVINALLAKPEYHLAYLRGYSDNMTVAQYHGRIAQIIRDRGIVHYIGKARSHTIYGDLSENALWQKG